MPKGGGSKTPQLDHFPLNTDMVEKQGGKKVRLKNPPNTQCLITKYLYTVYKPSFSCCFSLKADSKTLFLINKKKNI